MKGKLTVVSTGPGEAGYLIPEAKRALEAADTIVGYKTYIDLILELTTGKEIIANGMRSEVERCRIAIEKARSGNSVCLISGGDSGVYGLSGLILELLTAEETEGLTVIPGVTSATASAALLGAPLIHDFAVISLSDLLTEKSLIEKRLEAAAMADFVTVIYNPKSIKRVEMFKKTSNIFLKYRSSETPVGLVRNAYRNEQKIKITILGNLYREKWIDMRTTLIIGNSTTFIKGNRIITPRGYRL